MAKKRSPNYPAIGLRETIELAQRMWAKEHDTAVPMEVAAKALGYKGLSGPARTKLSALKKYGLLDERRDGVKLSDLAMRILHSPSGSDDYRRAVAEAAFTPELFRELRDTHPNASDDALKSHLIIKKGFSDAGARHAITAFRDVTTLADKASNGYAPDQIAGGSEAMSSSAVDEPTRLPSQRAPVSRLFS